MKINIKEILLENNMTAAQVRQAFNNNGNTAERVAAGFSAIPVVGNVASGVTQMVAGHEVGKNVGHPIVGTLLGRDAAVGAASNNVRGLKVGDVYTPKNILNKTLLAAGGGAGLYAADESMGVDHQFMGDDSLGNSQRIAAGALVAVPTISPAIRYGLGKVFGKRR